MFDKSELTLSEQFVWSSEKLLKVNYNNILILEIEGNLDIDCLSRSILELIKKNEILNTVFPIVDNCPTVKVNSFILSQSVLQLIENQDINQLIKTEKAAGFDLENGPLYKFKLVKCKNSAQKFFLILHFHHIICDGLSLNLFFLELIKYYDSFCSNKTINYTSHQYSNYRSLEHQKISNKNSKRKKDLVAAIKSFYFPKDYYPKIIDPHKGKIVYSKVNNALLKRLIEFCSEYKQQSHSLFYSVLAIILFHWTKNKTQLARTVYNRRAEVGLHKAMGDFVTDLPLLLTLETNDNFLEVCKKVHKEFLFSASNQEENRYIMNKNPQWDYDRIIFNLINFDTTKTVLQNDLKFAVHQVDYEDFSQEWTLCALFFLLARVSDGYVLTCTYPTDLYDDKTINALCKSYVNILEKCLQNPLIKIEELSINSELNNTKNTKIKCAIVPSQDRDFIKKFINLSKDGADSKFKLKVINLINQNTNFEIEIGDKLRLNEKLTLKELIQIIDVLNKNFDISIPYSVISILENFEDLIDVVFALIRKLK